MKGILKRKIESGDDATAPVDTAEGDDTVGTKVVMSHPGPIVPTEEITLKECQWQDGFGNVRQIVPEGEEAHYDNSRRPTNW